MSHAPRLVDLHTHTTASDGTDSPSEVVRKAAKLGLLAVAITDHDTTAGHAEAFEAGKKYQIEVIGGCELSTTHEVPTQNNSETKKLSVHILGLWLPKDEQLYADYLYRLQNVRNLRNMQMIEKLQGLGVNISYEELLRQTKEKYGDVQSIGRPHIASALVQAGYIAQETDAYPQYIGMGAPAYVARQGITPQEAVAFLASIGATVAMAHPMIINWEKQQINDLIADLKAAGLHAIEAYHPSHNQEQVRQCVELASHHGLALSGGSDYHGTAKPKLQLGSGKGGLRVAWHVLEALKEQRRKLGLPV
ncbi:MAG: PHP domain-containing protein [Pseudomonadota bacterium]